MSGPGLKIYEFQRGWNLLLPSFQTPRTSVIQRTLDLQVDVLNLPGIPLFALPQQQKSNHFLQISKDSPLLSGFIDFFYLSTSSSSLQWLDGGCLLMGHDICCGLPDACFDFLAVKMNEVFNEDIGDRVKKCFLFGRGLLGYNELIVVLVDEDDLWFEVAFRLLVMISHLECFKIFIKRSIHLWRRSNSQLTQLDLVPSPSFSRLAMFPILNQAV